MTLTVSQGLLVMKMCRVYNRYGQVFQFSGWKKYSLIWIPNTMRKSVQIYSWLQQILFLLSYLRLLSFTQMFYILSILAYGFDSQMGNLLCWFLHHCSWTFIHYLHSRQPFIEMLMRIWTVYSSIEYFFLAEKKLLFCWCLSKSTFYW